MRRFLRLTLRVFYLTLAFTLITLAIVVQLGRSLTYLVSDYREELASVLSQQTGTRVELSALNADWSGLQPLLEADDIRIYGQNNEQLLAMDEAQLRLNLLASLWHRAPVWSSVMLRGGDITLHQDKDGRWRLQGSNDSAKPMSAESQSHIVDILLAARRIGIEQTQVNVQFLSGDSFTLKSPNLLLENRGDFHRLLLQLGVEDNANAIYMVLEAKGDPRENNSQLQGYLQLRDFSMARAAAILPKTWLEGTGSQIRGRLDATLWLSRGKNTSPLTLQGDMRLSEGSVKAATLDLHIEHLQTDLSGYYQQGGWQLGLESLFVAAGGVSQSGLQLSLEQSSPQAPLIARMNRLDLPWLSRQLNASGAFVQNDFVTSLLQELNPRGQMRSLQLTVPLGNTSKTHFAAQLQSIAVDGWRGVPAFTDVNGYLDTGLFAGHIQLNSQAGFSMAFEGVYAHPLEFDSAAGSVAWRVRPKLNDIDVYSGPLEVSDGAENARGVFHLSLPIQRRTGPIDLTIALTATDVLAQQYRKYLPEVVPASLTQYVQRGIGRDNPGLATSGAFIYRGTLNEKGAQAYSVGLDLQLEQAAFLYHPDWPPVQKVNGRLVVDDGDLHGRITAGEVYNSEIAETHITLADNPYDQGKWLQISGKVDGIASDGLRILRQSVLRQFVGSQMDSWYLHGDLIAALDLGIPLEANAKGAYQKLALDIDASMFALDNFNLELSDLSGRISYDSETGLGSDTLTAKLFGSPTNIEIGTLQDGQMGALTTVDVETSASVTELVEWTGQPTLQFAQGEMPLEVHIELNHNYSRQQDASDDARVAAVSVQADLENTTIDLPPPLNKSKGEAGVLALNYILGAQTALADIHYLDRLRALMHLTQDGKQLKGGAISLGGEPELAADPALRITGELESIDPQALLDAWETFREIHREEAETTGGGAGAMLSVPVEAEILLKQHRLAGIELQNLEISVKQKSEAWHLGLKHPVATGELDWPSNSNQPLRLHVEHLRLPSSLWDKPLPIESAESAINSEPVAAEEHSQPDTAKGLWRSLESWPRAEVTIDDVKVDDETYGRWQFEFDPKPGRLDFVNVKGNIRGIEVAGLEPDTGASFFVLSDDNPGTQLQALLSAEDMGQVLSAWGTPASIESESARYRLNIGWPGAPQDFALATVSGQVQANIENGRFIRTNAGASEGLLRLMGLFNFDSLARRVRLDFSDLYKSGLTFDHINGGIEFTGGQLNITEPVQMQSPSGRMQLQGSVDLLQQTLDTRLVATIPMGGNLTVITALAAGLPAAAGVFVLSKLFEDQMNKVTSVSYKITGSWDEPVSEFEGVAEDLESEQ
ncbi:YhdP family protein [Gilvimarinus chinensis]|uniref:YhdP family protein n=1 Tax=Gilvimarinus chinensis TaxID=396005 RepID=UPI0003709636|nr:YhdP family protein [Gilvimarinus chinensis]